MADEILHSAEWDAENDRRLLSIIRQRRTTAPTQMTNDIERLLELAAATATEIRAQSINGWGNTVDDLAATIRQLQAQLAEAERKGWNEAIEVAVGYLSTDGSDDALRVAIRTLTRPTPTAGEK